MLAVTALQAETTEKYIQLIHPAKLLKNLLDSNKKSLNGIVYSSTSALSSIRPSPHSLKRGI